MACDNLLERAFMARIRADEYREALAALQKEFDEREDVIALKRRTEHVHLLLIGLDGEARFGDRQLGCIAVAPVEVE